MSNAKNLLQEYCQKNKMTPLPYYETSYVIDGYQCILTVSSSPTVTIFKSAKLPRKKDATMDAAKKAVEFFKISINIEESTIECLGIPKLAFFSDRELYKPVPFPKILILVDLENVNYVEMSDYSKYAPPDSYILGFISSNNHQYKYINQFLPVMDVYIVHSKTRDACDHLMTFISGWYFFANPKPTINTFYILTNDHFGSCLAEIMSSNHSFIKAKHFNTFGDFVAQVGIL